MVWLKKLNIKMNKEQTKRISKLMSLALRHQPSAIGITLDEEGWVLTQDLIDGINKRNINLNIDMLRTVVEENDKKRFTFNDDESKIRANQGHSVDIDLKLEAVEPPEILYHGTVSKFMKSIREKGLVKGSRQHVHLSKDTETATIVGTRRGVPDILIVNAKLMYDEGYKFYVSKNGVWLSDEVPSKFIEFKDHK
jgi:putative RNA 2'-phosphotransferase